MIATSPWLSLTTPPAKTLLNIVKLLRKIYPSLSQNTNLDSNSISRQVVEVEKYRNDKLNHGKINVAMFLGIVEAGLWAIENGAKTSYPTLIHHVTGYKITSHEASMAFAKKTDLCKVQLWGGAYHELHHEEIREDLFQGTSCTQKFNNFCSFVIALWLVS